MAGTTTTDSTCASITNCTAGVFVSAFPEYEDDEAITNMQCTPCDVGKFSTETNAVECIPHSTCKPPYVISNEGSAKADRECLKCALGKFTRRSNQETCTPYIL